jgi:hypothetical protein
MVAHTHHLTGSEGDAALVDLGSYGLVGRSDYGQYRLKT